eukprot:scaffold15044_cov37-Cyclotella_meneghiniana.AAC.3
MALFNEIKDLCMNEKDRLSETELVSRLKATQIDPDVLSTRSWSGMTLLHLAAFHGRSPEFCSVLHQLDVTLVKTQDNEGWLPMHHACALNVNVETAKYLFSLYPGSINIPNVNRWYPLHVLATNDESLQLLAFLLNYDEGAVSTDDNLGQLPLHLACRKRELPFVKLLFDAHPDGIFVQDEDGETPVDNAIRYRDGDGADVVNFLETQLDFRRQSQDNQEPDINGQLPIHQVLQLPTENVSLGTIKLMVGAHRASVTVADIQGCIPLHYACRFGDLNIVEYLVEQDINSLTNVDNMGNLPIHHACLGGRPGIVRYILMTTDYGVTVQNNDGKLPIELLLFDAVCARDLQHMDAVDSLLRANPVDSLKVISPGLFKDER